MISTTYGDFDGATWEELCKICFIQKYQTQNTTYVPVPATPGDSGIEGFTYSGKVFQCYCPNESYTSDELYKKQRDKITTDLNKLKSYERDLKEKIGENMKINEWYFVTPSYRKNDIINHCRKKEEEVKKWKLSIIDNENFKVTPQDIAFLHPELRINLNSIDKKIKLNPKKDPLNEDILSYQKDTGALVNNLQRKQKKRLGKKIPEPRLNIIIHNSIEDFLIGSSIIDSWQDLTSDDYENFKKIIAQEEKEIYDICASSDGDHKLTYKNIKERVEERLKEEFSTYELITIKNLANYVISDWLQRCPLNFDRDE
ncbi:hypothetical protein WAF17_02845 [Bernardetia sp. ABR2-2B]|uniref:hypothetical protein n=1 Tax=Bernardetia sp. ABR2-2B TaxID=3127472 RepID=UPI0030CCFCDC